jgi:galactokinase
MKTTVETTDIAQLHRMEYEASPDVVVSAPGCIRLIGEHTADSDGLMIAFPMDRRISVAISGRRDSSIRFYAADMNERKRTNLSNLKYKREDRWANFIKASLSTYASEPSGLKGFNITVSGDIPQALGLGSATALQCAAAKAAALSAGFDPSPEELARAIVRTDRSYFERDTKTAFYLATLASSDGAMIYVDASAESREILPSVFSGASLVLTDSKVPRPLVDSEMRQRGDDCAKGLSMMDGSGSKRLRDFSIDDLDEYMGLMPERVRRHCAFFVEEVQRVREAREASLHGDLNAFAKILNKSQSGLRNSYEISCPEIDWLVKRAVEIDGVLASRMIGRGFGGCTISAMSAQAIDEYRARLEEYERIFGFKPQALEISVGAGMIAV